MQPKLNWLCRPR